MQRLLDQLLDDFAGGLLARYHSDALTRHERAILDVALDHRAPERAGPEMLDLELRRLLIDLALAKALHHLALELDETPGSAIIQSPHRDHRKTRIELHRRHRIASGGADEGLFELRMRHGFTRADEARSKLAASGAHLQIGQDRLATADAAGHEDRRFAKMRQYLLGEHAGRDRTDMPARLRSLDNDRLSAGAHQLAGNDQRRREADEPSSARSHPRHGRRRRQTAGEDDMADAVIETGLDQLHQ